MVLPVIFLSMAVLLTVFFVCLSAISENSKIHIGVVVPEKGFMERGLLEYVSNMADTKALCVFRELSETEAKEQLDEGKVAAYVTLPENLLEKIYRNEKTVAMDMNRNYIRFVLRQETLFHEKTIKSASGMNDTTRIFLGIMVTLFVLLGAILISLRERPTALLLGLLKGKKINPVDTLFFDVLLNGGVLFLCMTAGFYGFAALLGVKVTMLNTCGIVFCSVSLCICCGAVCAAWRCISGLHAAQNSCKHWKNTAGRSFC